MPKKKMQSEFALPFLKRTALIIIVQFGLKPELTWLTQEFIPEPGLTGGVNLIFDRCVFAEFYQDFLWPPSES